MEPHLAKLKQLNWKESKMKYQEIADKIVNWLTVEHISSKQKGFVLGLSGGVDSALVAKLCAMTQIPTHIVSKSIVLNSIY